MSAVIKFLTERVLPKFGQGKAISNFLANVYIAQYLLVSALIWAGKLTGVRLEDFNSFLDANFPYFVTILGLRVAGGTANKIIEKVTEYRQAKGNTGN